MATKASSSSSTTSTPATRSISKKLLIELYDRKLISRSSLQLKMDLDPDIEAANRETERKQIDLMDEKR